MKQDEQKTKWYWLWVPAWYPKIRSSGLGVSPPIAPFNPSMSNSTGPLFISISYYFIPDILVVSLELVKLPSQKLLLPKWVNRHFSFFRSPMFSWTCQSGWLSWRFLQRFWVWWSKSVCVSPPSPSLEWTVPPTTTCRLELKRWCSRPLYLWRFHLCQNASWFWRYGRKRLPNLSISL